MGKKWGRNREDVSGFLNTLSLRLWALRHGQLLPWVLTGTILTVGVGVSLAIALIVSRWELASYRLQFQRHTENLATALQRSLNHYTEVLYALGDFYQVKERDVSPQEFNTFVRRSLLTYPGIQALEWAPVVPMETRNTFEQTMRSTLTPNFTITERSPEGAIVPAGERSHYIPVTYVQPQSGNEPALGFDLASNKTRRSALETARDTGHMTASARIHLIQEQKDQFGFLVFLPVYGSRLHNTLQLRRQTIQGYLLGVFRVSDVVEDSLRGFSYDIDFYLYDQSAEPGNRFLGFYDSHGETITVTPDPTSSTVPWLQPKCPRLSYCVHALSVGGRQWAIQFLPADTYPSPFPVAASATLIIGVLFTGLITLYLTRSQSELQRTKELSDLKLRLFSMASHEFRTPLSTILISAQSLEAHSASPLSQEQTTRIYTRIRSSAKRLNQLLSDILTLTRAEAGKLTFSPELINLQQFCQRLVDDIQGSVETPRLIEFHIDGACDRAWVDPKLLQAILMNLLSNAIKYSDTSQPVEFRIISKSDTIEFRVGDRGIGIPNADQDNLYEAFYRGQNVGAIAGTGLGLSVVKTCLNLHQGQITIDSKEGKGTTVTVTLPSGD